MDSVLLSDAIVEDLGRGFVRALRTAWPTLVSTDLDGIEQQLQEIGRQVLGPVAEQTVAAIAAAQPLVPPPCARCEQPMRLVEPARARQLQGLVGEYTLRRPYWHCASCHQGAAPLHERLGLGAGALSPGLCRVACRLGIADAFSPATGILFEPLRGGLTKQ